MSTTRRCLNSPWSLFGTSPHPTTVSLVNIMVMNGLDYSHPFPSMSIGRPIPDIRLSQTQPLKPPSPRSWVWSKARSCNQPSNLLIPFLFILASIRPILDIELFRNFTLKQGQCHQWGQKSRSPMHFLFISCDQAALRTLLSVSVCPVCYTFFTMFLLSDYHWQ